MSKPDNDAATVGIKDGVSDETGSALQALTQKMDALAASIPEAVAKALPPDFCKEFPNLCRLSGQVKDLSEEIAGIKKAIPTEITVKVPKPEKLDIPAPIIDVEALTGKITEASAHASIETSKRLKASLTKAQEELTPRLDTIIKTLEQLSVAPKSTTMAAADKIPEELPETSPKETAKETPQNTSSNKVDTTLSEPKDKHVHIEPSTPVHQTAAEFLACPECNAALLKALQSKVSEATDLDDATKSFIAGIKELMQEKGEGTHDGEDGDQKAGLQADRNKDGLDSAVRSATGGEGGKTDVRDDGRGAESSDGTDTRDDIAIKSAEPGPKSSIPGDTDKCTSGFCLLRGLSN